MLRVGYLTSQLLGPSLSSLPAALPTIDFNSSHTRLPVLPKICTHFKKFLKILLIYQFLKLYTYIHVHINTHTQLLVVFLCLSLLGMLSAMMAGRDCLIFVAES